MSFGVLRKEKCTGDPARRLGNDLAASQVAEANIETLRAAKVGRWFPSARIACAPSGPTGASPAAHSRSSITASCWRGSLRACRPPRGRGEKVVFHDPCYLGRYRNIYDAPRAVAARSAEVVEPASARERSFCCGAGGGQMFLGEEKGKRVNLERAEELAGAGAQAIATACPFCQSMFRDALGALGGTPPAAAGHRADRGPFAAAGGAGNGSVTTASGML